MTGRSKLDDLASVIAAEDGCGGGEDTAWCWRDKERTNCSCRNKAKARLERGGKGSYRQPALPLKLFDEGSTIEIQDADGRVLVKWTGFEASDFGISVQRRFAKCFVAAANKKKP